ILSAIRNFKSYIGQKLTYGKCVDVNNLRAIMISAAARYCALEIKIPDARDDSWTYAFRIIRYFPSNSARHLQALNRILKLHNKLTVEA
ncbi:Uncharacterized protein FKW44_007708, partial [Caligus rogercresseyi]